MKYIFTDYFEDFECIADKCMNTCCCGWEIIIDEQTCKKMAEKEDILGVSVKDWMYEKDDKTIVIMRHGACPMLNEKKLCNVVLKLGNEYLSETCRQYPRIINQYGQVTEVSLNISCPSVIGRLMDETDISFDFIEDNEPNAADYPHMKLYLFESRVRSFIIKTLQENQCVSLEARLFMAFKILQKAIVLWEKGHSDFSKIMSELEPCVSEENLCALSVGLNQTVKESNRYNFLLAILSSAKEIKKDINVNETYALILENAINYFAEKSYEEYLADLAVFRKNMQSYQHFYLNYWVWRIFVEVLTIPDYGKTAENFLYIAANFSLFQLLAFTFFSKKGKLAKEDYIYIISASSRYFEHSTSYRKIVIETLKTEGAVSTAGLMLAIFL